MKLVKKILGIVAVIAVIGFITLPLTGCPEDVDDGDKTVVPVGPSGLSMAEAIPLTENVWANGNIPTSTDEQWFKFTATATNQYIHVSFGTLNELLVRVYDSNGTEVGTYKELSPTFQCTADRTTIADQEYYIKVYSIYYSGTYQITFNTSTTLPAITLPTENVIRLTADTWANGNIAPSDGEQWFKFTATASTQYIHVNLGTLSALYVQVYDSDGYKVYGASRITPDYTDLYYTNRPTTASQEYYIKVTPGSNYGGVFSGAYKIGFNTSFVPPGVTTLESGIWADGNLTANGEQWFKFTATATNQYIHVSFGTLNNLAFSVCNSNGTTVGSDMQEIYSYTTNKYTNRTTTADQEYYIKVRSINTGDSGTYKIAFNTSTTPPSSSP
jgi:hypothetical protein